MVGVQYAVFLPKIVHGMTCTTLESSKDHISLSTRAPGMIAGASLHSRAFSIVWKMLLNGVATLQMWRPPLILQPIILFTTIIAAPMSQQSKGSVTQIHCNPVTARSHDSQVAEKKDQEAPPCHATYKTLHKQSDYDKNSGARHASSVTRAAATYKTPAHRLLFFVSFEIYSEIIPFFPITRTPTTNRCPFLHPTYTALVYVNPCRARTLQFKVTTVLQTQAACCAKTFSNNGGLPVVQYIFVSYAPL